MEERSYDIHVHSRVIFNLTFAGCMVMGLLMAFKVIDGDKWYFSIPAFLMIYLLSFQAAYYVSRGKVRIMLASDGITTVWLKQFFLGKRQSFSIPWPRVESYEICFRYEASMNNAGAFFDAFYIKLSSNRRFKLVRAYSFFAPKDDWKRFITEFEEVSNAMATDRFLTDKTKQVIPYRETTYEVVFKGMAVFGLVVLVFFTWMKLSGQGQIKDMSWWVLIAMAFFVVSNGIIGFRKKNQE